MSALNEFTFFARWIFPIDPPPVEQGTITVRDDKIISVEPHGQRQPDIDLGNVAILPGFVNAHTHLDLSGARSERLLPMPDFTQWLRHVILFRRSRTPEQVQADIAVGMAECLRHGTTLVGDISAGGASWELLGRSRCRARMYYELLGLAEERARQSWKGWQDWCLHRPMIEQCFTGLS